MRTCKVIMRKSGRTVDYLSSLKTLLCSSLVPLVLGAASVCAQAAFDKEPSDKHNTSDPGDDGIRLVLQTQKRVYRVGDPLIITCYLENISDKYYFVANGISAFNVFSYYHVMELSVIDSANKKIKPVRLFADPAPSELVKPVAEKLANNYVQLNPHMIVGFKVYGSIRLKPGRYRYTATYREFEAKRWPASERPLTPVKVWIDPIVSNTVEINVLSRAPKERSATRRN